MDDSGAKSAADPRRWRNLTAEPALDPDLPICDPHHHLWADPREPYLVDEFLADLAGGHRVESTVYVECQRAYRTDGPAPFRPVGETEFVHGLTASMQSSSTRTRVAAGIVGFADLSLGAAVEDVLLAHRAASDRFRGIRHASAWDPDPRLHPAHTNPPPGLLARRDFREGFATLGRLGLVFDAWLYFPQLPDLVALARAHPEVSIAVNHAGGPIGIGPYDGRRADVLARWRQYMVELATCDNVFVKLGGLSMKSSGFGWHRRAVPPGSTELAAAMRPYVETCIEYFGSSRCMFESNFPIDRVSGSYTVLWNAFKRLTAPATAAERASLLCGTAVRLYRL